MNYQGLEKFNKYKLVSLVNDTNVYSIQGFAVIIRSLLGCKVTYYIQ